MKRRLVLAALSFALSVPTASHAIQFRTVALSGRPAPETPAGILFDEFTHAVINQSGDVAFNAVVAGPGVTSGDTGGSTGIWATHPGGTRKVVRSGDQAVDSATGALMGTQSRARIDDQGRVAFVGHPLQPGNPIPSSSLFSEGLGVLRLVDPPTGSSSPGFSGNGKLAVRASVPNSGPFSSMVRGIWTDVSGTMVNIIREGDLAPGFNGLAISSVESPVINDNDVIVFASLLENRSAGIVMPVLWKYEGGVLSPFTELGSGPRINNAGQVLFRGYGGIFRYSHGVTEPVANFNVQAPGAAPGELLRGVDVLRINGVGDATFFGELMGPGVTGSNRSALWTERNGQIEMVARASTQAPGVASGVNFLSFQTFSVRNPDLAVNSAGQAAFEARLSGAAVDASNDAGIWATDLTGTLRNIVRTGDLFDVQPDPLITDLRTISTAHIAIAGSNGEDGWYTSFNDAGELVATLSFTDGTSGIFVFATAVPEPGTLALAGLGIVAGLSRARRK